MNVALTIKFLLSTFGVFACGIPSANWDRLGFGATNIIMNLSGITIPYHSNIFAIIGIW
jgi:hypothetical protein